MLFEGAHTAFLFQFNGLKALFFFLSLSQDLFSVRSKSNKLKLSCSVLECDNKGSQVLLSSSYWTTACLYEPLSVATVSSKIQPNLKSSR